MGREHGYPTSVLSLEFCLPLSHPGAESWEEWKLFISILVAGLVSGKVGLEEVGEGPGGLGRAQDV